MLNITWPKSRFPRHRTNLNNRRRAGGFRLGLFFEPLEQRNMLANGVPTYDHVVVVMEENKAFDDIIGNSDAPYLNSLANSANGALFTNSFALQHPSQPNYLDLFSGSNQGVNDDSVPPNEPLTTPNLGAELLAASKTFVGYSEDLPSVGFNGATSGNYARKHSPWTNWQDAPTNGIPSADNQPFTSFPSDFTQLPTVSFVIPNLQDDMHDGTIAQGDTWLQNNLSAYATWATTHNSLLIVTWDEDDMSEQNQIPTIIAGQGVTHANYNEMINHYNVLRTIEDMYSLPYAGQSANVSPITDIWAGTAPTFSQTGSTLTVTGTSGADKIELSFSSATQFTVSVNDASNSYNTSSVSQVHLVGGGGTDEIIISDSINTFTASLSSTTNSISRSGFSADASGAASIYVYGNVHSTAELFDAATGSFVSTSTYSYITGAGFFDVAGNFGSLYGYAGGANDVASLYSAAGDSYVATPTYTYTADPVHQAFFNVAENFHNAYAYGNAAGTDTAYMYSAAGDAFIGGATYSYLTDPANHNFFDLVNAFHTVYAYASGSGTDTAYLYAAAGGAFVGAPTSSYLSGTNYFTVADNFKTVYAFSSGSGTDYASFYASGGNSFVGMPTESYLSANGVLIVAEGFVANYAYATAKSGATADLYDSSGNDSVTASGNTATMFTAPGPYYSVSGFDTVTAHESSGTDTEHIDSVFFNYEKTGTWHDV